jgi:hypothetical protein
MGHVGGGGAAQDWAVPTPTRGWEKQCLVLCRDFGLDRKKEWMGEKWAWEGIRWRRHVWVSRKRVFTRRWKLPGT